MAPERITGMIMTPSWLPELIHLESYGGNWERYLDMLYACFKADFMENKPLFQGQKIALKRHPMSQNKEATFWHLISKGKVEEERHIDLRRCERIRWPKAIIENSEDSSVKFWKNIRRSEVRICLWLEKQEYLLILAERKGYILPWTAYMVTKPHRKKKFQKEFEDYWEKWSRKS